MKLIEANIANFGVLHEIVYDFKDGLNVVLDGNGNGKSTLAAFVKAMFYGIGTSRKANIEENERKHFAPWQGGTFGGSLTFEAAGRTFRVERTFGEKAAKDTFALYDCATGLECRDYSEDLGEELFHVDAALFERSVWHPQRPPAEISASAVSARLGNLSGADDAKSYTRAVKVLDDRRRRYENAQKRGMLPDLRREMSENLARQQEVRASLSDRAAAEQALSHNERAVEHARRELDEVSGKIARQAAQSERRAKQETWEMLSRQRETARDALVQALTMFPNGVPSGEEVLAAQDALRERDRGRDDAGKTMELDEVNRLAQLAGRFPKGVPDEERMRRSIESAARLDEADRSVVDRRQRLVAERSAMTAGLPHGMPTPAACEEAYKAALTAHDAERDLQAIQSGDRKTLLIKCGIPFFCGIFLLFAGIGTAVAHAPALLPILLMIAGLGGIGAGVWFFLQERNTQNGRTTALELRRAESTAIVRRFLSEFGRPLTDDPLPAQVQQVALLVRDYLRLGEDLQGLELHETENKLIRRELEQLLALCDQPFDGAYMPAVMELSAAVGEYRALAAKRESTRTRMAEAAKAADEAQALLDTFFARYGEGLSDAEGLRVIRERLEIVKGHQNAVENAEKALAEFAPDPSVFLREEEEIPEDPAVLRETQSELQTKLQMLEGELRVGRQRSARFDELAEELSLLENEYRAKDETRIRWEENVAAITKTRELLSAAYDRARAGAQSLMQQGLRKYAALTGGDVQGEPVIDADLNVSVISDGVSRPYGHFSRGERDVFDICTRLALCDALFTDETPFLILDDPFTNLDDENLSRAMSLLKDLARERQIVYLVCHSSRT